MSSRQTDETNMQMTSQILNRKIHNSSLIVFSRTDIAFSLFFYWWISSSKTQNSSRVRHQSGKCLSSHIRSAFTLPLIFNIFRRNLSLRLFALQSSGVLDRNQSWLYSPPGSQTLTATFFVLTAISLPQLSISFVFMAAEWWGGLQVFFMGAPAGHGSCKWWLVVFYNPIQLRFFPVNT